MENKRWPTDKIISRFGADIVKGKHGNILNMIAKVLVELRNEAKIHSVRAVNGKWRIPGPPIVFLRILS